MFALQTTAKYRLIDTRKFGLTAAQMRSLGELGIGLIRDRAARGVGSDDRPMKPLNPFYAKRKIRAGLPPTRNLRGPGRGPHMLDSLSVRRAEQNVVRMDITTADGRLKATANEKKAPWYGFSDRDAMEILGTGMDMLKGNVREVTAERGLPIWMDPYRRRSIGYATRIA